MKFVKPILLLLLISSGILLYFFTPLRDILVPQRLVVLIETVRGTWWFPPVLILVYGVGGVFALPAAPLSLAIGAVYGLKLGFLYNTIAANFGAVVDFAVARYLGQDFIQRILKGKFQRFDQQATQNGFRYIFYLRLVPLFPFLGINFAAGLSRIRFRDYFLATVLGMIPGTFVYTYFASSLLTGAVETKREAMIHLVVSSLLFILLSLIPVFYKKFRRDRTTPA